MAKLRVLCSDIVRVESDYSSFLQQEVEVSQPVVGSGVMGKQVIPGEHSVGTQVGGVVEGTHISTVRPSISFVITLSSLPGISFSLILW